MIIINNVRIGLRPVYPTRHQDLKIHAVCESSNRVLVMCGHDWFDVDIMEIADIVDDDKYY